MSRIDKKADPAAETEPLFSTRLFLNAVMHRDYSGPADHVALAIFGDRLEIRSVGWLPSGITIDMLQAEKPTHRRRVPADRGRRDLG